tara:strand:+ start:100983 stop:101879 length:897 start_codon:yes stop_codon:yes gene_type:complete
MNLKGLGVAIITPFNEDFSVDFRALTNLINHVIYGGVDYIVSLGTTGESVVLSDQEKTSVIEHTINIVNKRVPICLGIGGNNTLAIVDEIKKTNFSNISAILSVSPYYNKPSQEGIFLHYKLISESSNVPIILYNVPGRTSSNIEASTTLKLASKFPNIIGIKEASADLRQINQIIRNKPKNFNVVSGDDDLTNQIIKNGGDGVISVVGQCLPELFSKMVHEALNKNFSFSDKISIELSNFIELLFKNGNPSGIKSALNHLNICENVLRLPLTSLKEVDYNELISELIRVKKISQKLV